MLKVEQRFPRGWAGLEVIKRHYLVDDLTLALNPWGIFKMVDVFQLKGSISAVFGQAMLLVYWKLCCSLEGVSL
jgi:hypothetical protein